MIEKIVNLENIDVSELLDSSRDEGYNMIFRLISDYKNGINKFDKNGEILVCYKENNRIIGICGLNIEPEIQLNNCARIRRLFVLSEFRENKIGKKLVNYLIEYAKNYFDKVTTNIGKLKITDFYLNCGFNQVNDILGITHIIRLNS